MFNSSQQSGGDGASFQLRPDRGTLLTGALLVLVALICWVGVVRQAGSMQSAGMPGASMQAVGTQAEAMPAPGAQADKMQPEGMPANGTQGQGMPASEMQPAPQAGAGATPMPSGPAAPWLQAAVAYLIAWGVMMAAMMLPSALPMIMLFNGMSRQRMPGGQKDVSTVLFALVYVAVWVAFGVPVYAASLLVGRLAAQVPAAGTFLPYAVAAVLLSAGLFQFTPLKRACLRVCQHPFVFMMGHWRSGYAGVLRMAAEHAAYCVGCCWALMVVMVAAGAMSLPWVFVIAIVVFAEKLLPQGAWTARAAGGALILLALIVAIQPGLAQVLRGMQM